MRSWVAGWRRGGKWWCQRSLCGLRRSSGVVGLLVSIWVCLMTFTHLSLEPAPVDCQLPCLQDRSGDSDRALLYESARRITRGIQQRDHRKLRRTEGSTALQSPDVLDAADGFNESPRLSRLPANVGPDQRMLLTNEETVDEDEDESFAVKDEQSELKATTNKSLSLEDKSDKRRSEISAAHAAGPHSLAAVSEDLRETQLQRTPVFKYAARDTDTSHFEVHPPKLSPSVRRQMTNSSSSSHVNNTNSRITLTEAATRNQEELRRQLAQDVVEPSPRARQKLPSESSRRSTSVLVRSQTYSPGNIPDKSKEISSSHRQGASAGGISGKALALDTEADMMAVGTRLKEDGFLLYAYNMTASDNLPMDRSVPDTRPEG